MTSLTTAVTAFALAAALIVVLPGPDTLVVVRAMVRGGRRRASWTALGGLTGLLVWVTLTVVGLAALLRASAEAFLVLKVAGAAYLLWVGIRTFRSAGAALGDPATPDESPRGRERRAAGYAAGLATNLLNPKVGVLFVALLPGFVPEGRSVPLTSLLLGAIYIAETALYMVVLVTLSDPVLRRLSDPRFRRWLDRVVGAVFVGFGVQLVTSRH